MQNHKTSILFLCTGNSARSILAEAICNQCFGESVESESAGSSPKSDPNPLALRTLAGHGLCTEGLSSKSWEHFRDRPFDLIITLCDAANEEPCPKFPGATRVHWSFPDPPAADDPEAVFEAVYETLEEVIAMVAEASPGDAADRARQGAQRVATRFG